MREQTYKLRDGTLVNGFLCQDKRHRLWFIVDDGKRLRTEPFEEWQMMEGAQLWGEANYPEDDSLLAERARKVCGQPVGFCD